MSNNTKNPYQNIIIVGCGGVGAWLAHLLAKVIYQLDPVPTLILWDGDRLEEKNLDRQLFTADQVGQFKSEAMKAIIGKQLYDVAVDATYFHDQVELPPDSLVFCCCDNHPARNYVLSACDVAHAYGSKAHAILAANETTDAEAYLYIPEWRNTPADPRIYYPEILTDQEGDPTGRTNCATLIQSGNPQLALANYMAAGQAAYLFWFLLTQAQHLTGEDIALWPVRHMNSLFRFSTTRRDELVKQQQPTEKETNGNTSSSAAVATSDEPATLAGSAA